MSKHARRIAKVSLNFLLSVAANRLLSRILPSCPPLVVEAVVTVLLELALPDGLRAVQRRRLAKLLATKRQLALPPAS